MSRDLVTKEPSWSMDRVRRILPPVILFAIALAVRLSFLLQIEAYPNFELIRNRLDDQVVFDYWAKSILRSETPDFSTTGHEFAYWAEKNKGVFPQAPLYPYFLAGLYKLLGFRYDWVRGIQMLLGSLTTVLVYLIGRRYLHPGPAFLCGLAAAFYGPFVFYEATFLRAGIFGFVAALCLYLLQLSADARSTPARPLRLLCVGAGLALAVGVLLRPNFLVFAIPATLWLYLERSSRQEPADVQNRIVSARGAAVLTLIGLVLPLIPVIAVNSIRSGRLAFISANGPYIFFIGNVHDAPGHRTGITPYYRAVKASGPRESVDLLKEALKDIRQHPKDYLRLQLRKVKYFFASQELPNNLSYSMAGKLNPALSLAFLEFYLIFPAALLGLALSFRNWRPFSLLHLFIFCYLVATVAFYVLSRLRQPVLIPLIVFAGLAAQQWWSAVAEKRFVRAVAGLTLVVLMAAYLKPHPARHRTSDYEMAAAAYFSLAGELERDMRLDEARRYYIRALVLNPDHDKALMQILTLGSRAPHIPNQDISSNRAGAEALSDEARQLVEGEEYNKALRLLEKAAQLAPDHFLPHHYLSNVYFIKGEHLHAMEHLEKALELSPESQLFRENLKTLRRRVAAPRR